MSATVVNIADARAARDSRRAWIVGLLGVGLLAVLCLVGDQ